MKHIPDDLYNQILRVLPIACVDLLILNEQEKLLLVKRKGPTAAGQWWFPGGRIYYGERREEAAGRILKEECGLTSSSVTELGTFDVIFDLNPRDDYKAHGITTVYQMNVEAGLPVLIDDHSSDYAWKLPNDWKEEMQHEFIHEAIKAAKIHS